MSKDNFCINPLNVYWTKEKMIEKWNNDAYVRELFPTLELWLDYYEKIK